MNTTNIILIVVGAIDFLVGAWWPKRGFFRTAMKILLLSCGLFCVGYAMYLGGYIVKIN